MSGQEIELHDSVPTVPSGSPYRDRRVFDVGVSFLRADGAEFFVFNRVLRTIEASLAQDPGCEAIGLLGGRVYRDAVGDYLVVTSAVAAHEPDATADDVVCSAEEFRSMARRLGPWVSIAM